MDHSTSPPDKPSSPTPASGSATPLPTKAGRNTWPSACQLSPWRPFTATNPELTKPAPAQAKSQELMAKATSFPLDGAWRFRRNVVNHAVHTLDFIHDPRGDFLQYFVWQLNPVCGHAIFRTHRPDCTCISVRPHVAHHAHRHHRQQYGKPLPDFGIEAGVLHLRDHNVP